MDTSMHLVSYYCGRNVRIRGIGLSFGIFETEQKLKIATGRVDINGIRLFADNVLCSFIKQICKLQL